MTFSDGCRIAHEFLDDVIRVFENREPLLGFDYHALRYETALASGMPDQWGLLLTVLTRFDVDDEKCRYASYRQLGIPELPYVYA